MVGIRLVNSSNVLEKQVETGIEVAMFECYSASPGVKGGVWREKN